MLTPNAHGLLGQMIVWRLRWPAGCVTCSPGYYDARAPSSGSSLLQCLPCPAGSVGDGLTCTECGAGTYVPRGTAAPCSRWTCEDGFTDHDLDPTTPCVPCHATTCPAGSEIASECSPTNDLACRVCPQNTCVFFDPCFMILLPLSLFPVL